MERQENGENLAADVDAPKKGVKTKIFGAGLIFLGSINTILAWRGAYAVPELQVAIIVAGLFLYILGVIRSGES